MQFVINNWYLFVALAVVLVLLFANPIRQALSGVPDVPIADAVLLVNHKAGVIVDVREPEEFKSGHIPKAINIPLSALPQRSKELNKYKDKPVVLCCRTGQRSARAASLLRQQGFSSVHNLSGGIVGWQRENLPTES